MSTVDVKRLIPPRIAWFIFNDSGSSNPCLFQINCGIHFRSSFANTYSLLDGLFNLQIWDFNQSEISLEGESFSKQVERVHFVSKRNIWMINGKFSWVYDLSHRCLGNITDGKHWIHGKAKSYTASFSYMLLKNNISKSVFFAEKMRWIKYNFNLALRRNSVHCSVGVSTLTGSTQKLMDISVHEIT